MAKSSSRSKKTTKAGNGKRRSTKSAPREPMIRLTLDQKLDILGVALVGVAAVTVLSMLSNSQGQVTG